MKKKLWLKIGLLITIVAVLFCIDIVSKYLLDGKIGQQVTIIPHLINFQIVHNMGAAWGMIAGKQVFLIALSFIFLAVFIVYFWKEKYKSWLLSVTFGFLIAGCIGNLYDRLVLGYVRDFIQFAFWQNFPVFNFADVFLCVGVVLFVIYLILYHQKSKKSKNLEEGKKDDSNL